MNHLGKAAFVANKFRGPAGRFGLMGYSPKRDRFRMLAQGGVFAKEVAKEDRATAVGELYIYEPIGWDCWTDSGITGNSVKEALDAMEGVKLLNIFINCEGGDVFEAKAIYSQLKRFQAEKIVHIDGIAASAATFIAMAGDRIKTSPVATWMVHQAWTGAAGRAVDLRACADLLDLENNTIAETYARRTKKTPAEMLDLMSAPPDGTWMNAAKALELGFTDEIVEDAEEGDAEGAKNSVRSPMFNALQLTRDRLKGLTPASMLKAKADMNRRRNIIPGQPGEPASR
jgi:ATP-dependent Clp protease protease subunit